MSNNVDLLFNMIDTGREGRNIGLKTGIEKLDKYIGGSQLGKVAQKPFPDHIFSPLRYEYPCGRSRLYDTLW